jgi:hypothetical protein
MPTKDEMAKFARQIETAVATKGYTYIEAIVAHCEATGLEMEVAATLVNANLKAKIENNAYDINMMKEKAARLPI